MGNIISVSRRTDIPAFYSEWFFNRIKEGYVLTKNPYNHNQLTRVSLAPKDVECFVFWTKDPYLFLKRLDLLEDYKYYFLFTITGYGNDIETKMRKKEDIIKTFKELSKQIGKEKNIWRYDPILLTDKYDIEYHIKKFEEYCSVLEGYTEKCIISFLIGYEKSLKNLSDTRIIEPSESEKINIAKRMALIAQKHHITLEACSEKIDLSSTGVQQSHCIDPKLISSITGNPIYLKKDSGQRANCGCVKSTDIGEYQTCLHDCKYCYAVSSAALSFSNHKKHNVNSPLLIGELDGNEKIYNLKENPVSYSSLEQISLF